MKATEVIEELNRLIDIHGNLDVAVMNHEYGNAHFAELEVDVTNADTELSKDFMDDPALGQKFFLFR